MTGFTSEFETSHSIALVSLLFIFVPLVVFSGSLGSFLTVNGPAEVLQKMRKNMTGDTCSDLFPDNKVIQCACIVPGPEEEKPCATAAVTHYSGIPLNSTWRPCKHILPVPPSFELEEQGERGLPFGKQGIREWWQNPNRSRGLLLGYSLSFVLLGACTPAVFLSATNYTNEKTLSIGSIVAGDFAALDFQRNCRRAALLPAP